MISLTDLAQKQTKHKTPAPVFTILFIFPYKNGLGKCSYFNKVIVLQF